MIADCEQMRLVQLPRLRNYILPDDVKEDSHLETNLAYVREAHIELGTLITEYMGKPDDSPEYQKLMCGMNALAYLYDELDAIRKEVAHYYL